MGQAGIAERMMIFFGCVLARQGLQLVANSGHPGRRVALHWALEATRALAEADALGATGWRSVEPYKGGEAGAKGRRPGRRKGRHAARDLEGCPVEVSYLRSDGALPLERDLMAAVALDEGGPLNGAVPSRAGDCRTWASSVLVDSADSTAFDLLRRRGWAYMYRDVGGGAVVALTEEGFRALEDTGLLREERDRRA